MHLPSSLVVDTKPELPVLQLIGCGRSLSRAVREEQVLSFCLQQRQQTRAESDF